MIELLWKNLQKYQGEEFHLAKGKSFTYSLDGSLISLSSNRMKIAKSTFEKALTLCPLKSTADVRRFVCTSYIYALLTDDRIIDGIDFSLVPKEITVKSEDLFEKSLKRFLIKSKKNILNGVSERSLCVELRDALLYYKNGERWLNGYYIDNEYNRNLANPTLLKTIINDELEIIKITCDVILHSRGEIVAQDNLMAIEMKKSTASPEEKTKDKNRLIALTKDSYDNIWSFDGVNLPEHVCGYALGVYLELDIQNSTAYVEYYYKGKAIKNYTLKF